MSDTARVRRAQDNGFCGMSDTANIFPWEEKMCFSLRSMSAVSDIPQKPLSWARLTQAMSDLHLFPFSKQEHRKHAECACGGKISADANNQMKPDLSPPLLQREA